MEHILEGCVRFLNITGSNPKNNNKILITIAFAIFVQVIIGTFMYLVFNWSEKSSFEGAVDLIVVWQVFGKFLCLLTNKKKTITLLKELDYFWPINKCGVVFQREIEKLHCSLKKFLRVLTIVYGVTALCYILRPIITRKRVLLLPAYISTVDVSATPAYEILYVTQVLGCIMGLSSLLGFDSIFICLVASVICEIKLIKKEFSRISVNEDNLLGLKRLIDQHSNALRFINKLNDYYSIVMLNQFLTSTFIICGALLILSNGGNSISASEKSVHVASLVTFMGQMFCYCIAGTYIVAESESIGDAAYEVNWFAQTRPQLRRVLVLSILRSHKESKLMAGGMFNLNLKSYKSIVRTGFSFFTLIRAVYNKNV